MGANLLLYAFFQFDVDKNILRIISTIICIVALFYKRKIRLEEVILLGISCYLVLINGDISVNMAVVIIIAVSMTATDMRMVFNIYNKMHIVMLIIVSGSLLFGIVQNTKWIIQGRIRNDFGFSHVNYVGLLFYSLISVYLISRKRINRYHMIFSLIASFIVFRFTNSRTGFYGTLILLFCIFIFDRIPGKYTKILSCIMVTALFLSPIIWKLPIINNRKVDYLLSGRVSLSLYYIKRNSVFRLLFGGTHVGEIDNSYLLILYNCGIIVYLILMAIVLYSCIKILEKTKIYEAAFIISTLSISLMESCLIRPEIPCMMLFWIIVFS